MGERKRLPEICVALCKHLGSYDASIEALAEHCECSVPSVRRALTHLRGVGVPIQHIRHGDNGRGLPTEHYWRLDRKLNPGEAGAFASFMFLPEDEAQDLLALAQAESNQPS